jgi:hypothetical protein
MRAPTFAAAALAAAAILANPAVAPAQAQGIDYPYCTVGGWATDGNCSFYTLEQCMAFVQGVGGSCVRNPRAMQPPQNPQGVPRQRR